MIGPCFFMSLMAFGLGITVGLSIRFAPIHEGIRTQADLAERNLKTSITLRELSETQRKFAETQSEFSELLKRREQAIREAEIALGLPSRDLDS